MARLSLIAPIAAAFLFANVGGGIAGEGGDKNPYRAAVAAAQPCLVVVKATLRRMKDVQGISRLGVVATAGGVVLTDGALRSEEFETTDLTVTFPGGKTHSCSYIGKDEDLNLAFLQLDAAAAKDLKALAFDRQERPLPGIGDELIGVGLLDESEGHGPQIARGMVTAVTKNALRSLMTDLSLSGSLNSPSPAFDASGRLVGLITSGHGQWVTPASTIGGLVAKPPRESLTDEAEKAWLGIVMQALNPDLAEYWKISEGKGVIVGAVVPGSPVEAVGVKAGDVLVSFDGWAIPVSRDADLPLMVRRVQATEVGRTVGIVYYRKGERREAKVRLGSRPKSRLLAEMHEDPDFGFAIREITMDLRLRHNLPATEKGIMVDRIESAGWAAMGGLRALDIVQRVDNAPCPDVKAFKETMDRIRQEKRKKVVFMVKRGVDTEFVVVNPDWEGAGAREE